MKNKIVLGGTGLILLILPLFFLICGFLLPPQYEDTFLGELKYKRQRLAQTEGKRIILVGGSSVAFGTDSTMLKETFSEYEIVNFGMYAALGTTVMLDLSLEDLREGDVVILSPEQEEQTLSGYFDAGVMWQAADGDFSVLSRLNSNQRRAMIGQFPYFAVEKFLYTVHRSSPAPEGVYRRDSFNLYGDVDVDTCRQNIMPGGYDDNMDILFETSMVNRVFIDAVNNFTQKAEEKGAVVWYRFCPMNQAAIKENQDVDHYYDFLSKELVCQIIGNPHQCILEPEWFYDTNFHLNNNGKKVNTIQLIRDLKAQWRDSSKTEISFPEKPELTIPETVAGEEVDSEYFEYKRQSDYYVIIGLTEDGKKRKNLVVPSTYKELPVTSIEEGAFSGNKVIQSITLQENVKTIADRAFDGCNSLETIILEAINPADCRPGQELLEGTEAWIVVEPQAESDYKTNYFWNVYGSRIRSR